MSFLFFGKKNDSGDQHRAVMGNQVALSDFSGSLSAGIAGVNEGHPVRLGQSIDELKRHLNATGYTIRDGKSLSFYVSDGTERFVVAHASGADLEESVAMIFKGLEDSADEKSAE